MGMWLGLGITLNMRPGVRQATETRREYESEEGFGDEARRGAKDWAWDGTGDLLTIRLRIGVGLSIALAMCCSWRWTGEWDGLEIGLGKRVDGHGAGIWNGVKAGYEAGNESAMLGMRSGEGKISGWTWV